jgi:ParB/RepB/Spo0J family partition protein
MQFDPNYIRKLAEDIEAEGQLKPIMVRPHPSQPDKYQIIDGENRIRALQKLGKTLVRAEVHTLSDDEAYYRAMRINQLHGKSLEDVEEGAHLLKMMGVFGYNQQQVAKKFSRSEAWVSYRVGIATKLAPETERAYVERRISTVHARELALLPKEEQEKVVTIVAKEKLSTRATEGLVHAIKEAGTPEQKLKILAKPMKLYADTFKDPKQMKTALLTIKPEDDFLAKMKEIKTEAEIKMAVEKAEAMAKEPITTVECPHCGQQFKIEWLTRKLQWE